MMIMNGNRQNHVLKLCVTALMAALVFWGSWAQIQIPAIVGFSRFHLGNIMCALSGILLGPWWGGLASGLGSMLFDCTNPAYLPEAPITFVFKGMYGLIAGSVYVELFKRRSNYGTELIATVCAASGYIVLYLSKNFFYNNMFLAGLTTSASWVAMLEKAPSALFNGVVAVVFAPILGVAVNKALKAAHLDRMLA